MSQQDDTIEESLTMFFDNDFNPPAYIDKLVQSITVPTSALPTSPNLSSTTTTTTTTATPISAYSKNSLSKLSNDISQLIIHLDYYTNELSNNNLKHKLDALNKSNTLIYSRDDESTGSTTRLQYHINVLNNSILSLQAELNGINEKLDINHGKNEAINDLIQLKQVKANLTKVLTIFELVNNSLLRHDSYSVEQFQEALNELFDSIKQQLDSNVDQEKLLAHINKLIDLSSVFSNLAKFNPIFKKFISQLTAERDQFLKH
ncbi:uncharacterized protein SPAPADRAFT_61861 [Spathaspora passalidarum NRRL Y-27907]|uniref:Uncharacterized protein n=1 Tax=Spathaspora passalidarum (strain NRRL Y-27907 / 11-Y1) TaxID=619300 RepID=G3ARH0_SPAPN|nr:uncharacterized protein SPAPADRAFT_61861 [Spathaspora passalidarum NRRL Y-27907]EGW31291.1 hypothetical protein SPAPADRAFT_61861 [Spathaspora passalidarum NRRL Y-27907]